ncbi:hypothetical protein DFR58_108160 [Anaerobacterium chartisolvens]|uniref:Lipoprotein n=1 Tax=Anaerobacterium chartisolvens TaxID=1297424 RepID=A0A369B7H5_9FIRM|nr:DUF5991 domain-containing protein [Anaerobacterium chartisolvens]RCX17265.1 hypothetical protein DFR58_108160 [Anaerobacterium chartisolvens]
MYILKKLSIIMAITITISMLMIGCSRTVVPENSAEDKISNNSNNASKQQDNLLLKSWAGNYVFSEFAPPNQNMFYRFSVYEENGEYYADINIDGFQTIIRLKAKVLGDEEAIKLAFYKYLPDNISEQFMEGDVLLSFEKKNSKLYTFWGKIQPILEQNTKSGEIYFELES